MLTKEDRACMLGAREEEISTGNGAWHFPATISEAEVKEFHIIVGREFEQERKRRGMVAQ